MEKWRIDATHLDIFILILKMGHPNAAHRPSVTSALDELNALIAVLAPAPAAGAGAGAGMAVSAGPGVKEPGSLIEESQWPSPLCFSPIKTGGVSRRHSAFARLGTDSPVRYGSAGTPIVGCFSPMSGAAGSPAPDPSAVDLLSPR